MKGIKLILAVIASVMLAMTYAWTPVSYEYTEGVQGRYFLPLLLLIPLFPKKGIADSGDGIMKGIVFFTALLNTGILMYLYRVTIVNAV